MTRKTIELFLLATGLVFGWMSVDSWLALRDAKRQFATAIAAQQKVIARADAAEHQQQDNLKNLLTDIADLKSKTRTPTQIVKELPKYLPLPTPILLASTQQAGSIELGQRTLTTDKPLMPSGTEKTSNILSAYGDGPSEPASPKRSVVHAGDLNAKLPIDDLKPLFDFVQNCRTCDAELEAAQRTTANDSVRISALTRERDIAIRAERGSLWRSVRRSLAWFAFGAMAGYVAAQR